MFVKCCDDVENVFYFQVKFRWPVIMAAKPLERFVAFQLITIIQQLSPCNWCLFMLAIHRKELSTSRSSTDLSAVLVIILGYFSFMQNWSHYVFSKVGMPISCMHFLNMWSLNSRIMVRNYSLKQKYQGNMCAVLGNFSVLSVNLRNFCMATI